MREESGQGRKGSLQSTLSLFSEERDSSSDSLTVNTKREPIHKEKQRRRRRSQFREE